MKEVTIEDIKNYLGTPINQLRLLEMRKLDGAFPPIIDCITRYVGSNLNSEELWKKIEYEIKSCNKEMPKLCDKVSIADEIAIKKKIEMQNVGNSSGSTDYTEMMQANGQMPYSRSLGNFYGNPMMPYGNNPMMQNNMIDIFSMTEEDLKTVFATITTNCLQMYGRIIFLSKIPSVKYRFMIHAIQQLTLQYEMQTQRFFIEIDDNADMNTISIVYYDLKTDYKEKKVLDTLQLKELEQQYSLMSNQTYQRPSSMMNEGYPKHNSFFTK